MRLAHHLSFLAILELLFGSGHAAAPSNAGSRMQSHVPGQVLVQYKEGATASQQQSARDQAVPACSPVFFTRC